ncbi:hypothetical protein ACLGI4_08965 [Streptomyces sp. HMX112]|uniref:hypothetical protein n=1 Tax=Streptomyces sp. HMX112 TaxID=3390850 RepID=UPI003A800DAB
MFPAPCSLSAITVPTVHGLAENPPPAARWIHRPPGRCSAWARGRAVSRGTPAPALPPGYARETSWRDGVLRVRILATVGTPAARGQLAPTGRTAVADQIETYPGHRRRGPGRAVTRVRGTAGAGAGAVTGVLAATTRGRALDRALGWRYQGPLTGVLAATTRGRALDRALGWRYQGPLTGVVRGAPGGPASAAGPPAAPAASRRSPPAAPADGPSW